MPINREFGENPKQCLLLYLLTEPFIVSLPLTLGVGKAR